MRVSPRDLRAVQRDGLLTRFAILGPVVFVMVELPGQGSAGSAKAGAPPVQPANDAPADRPAPTGVEAGRQSRATVEGHR